MLIKIIIKDGELTEKILKKFKRKVEQSAILKELRKRECFLKPSIKKKIKTRTSYIRNKKRKKKSYTKIFF